MNSKSNLVKYIIVLGTTYSGSGAVYDYLAGRGDLRDPLLGKEYQLPQMPNGLMSLEATTGPAFHPGTSDFVISQFQKTVKKLCRSGKPWRYGEGYNFLLPSFERQIEEFINEICAANFPMRLTWQRLMKSQSPIRYFINLLNYKFNLSEKVPQSRLLVCQNDFIIAAQNFHNKLFQIEIDKRPILLNQAGSGWNPINSTKYFLNRKIVLITRDPRDQFAELKLFKKANSVKEFINWYKEMQIRLKHINNPLVMHIRFEDFVKNNKKMVQTLCNHVSITSNILSNYKPNSSKKNIGKYTEFLDQKEINDIETNLLEYIYF
jgi:hypothetical protein